MEGKNQNFENSIKHKGDQPINLLKILNQAPDPYLIITPEFRIIMANAAYINATLSNQRQIIGKHIFEAFPDNPQTPHANSVNSLRTSLEEVLVTKKAHRMEIQHYDVPRAVELGGGFEEKHWSPVNTPVLNERGEVEYIIHKVVDVTELVRNQAEIKDLSKQTEILVDAIEEVKDKSYQLEESKSLLKAIFNISPHSIVILKILLDKVGDVEDFEMVMMNEFTEKITGVCSKNASGKRYSELFPHVIKTSILGEFKKVATTGEDARFEQWYEGDGMKSWFYFQVKKLKNLLVVTTEDITERKKAEANLLEDKDKLARQATEKYRSLFNSMDEGFCILKLIFDEANKPIDYRYIDINPVFEKQTGMKDALGKTVRELVPNIEPFWFDIYGRVALTGESTQFEDHAVSMNRWFAVNAFRIGNPDDKHVAVLFNDISQRKESEEVIRESESRFRTMAEASGILISHTDANGKAVYFNKEWLNLTGSSMDELLQYGGINLWHPDDKELFIQAYNEAVEKKEVLRREFRIRSYSGDYRWLLCIVSPRITANDKYAGHISSCIDITPLKVAEEALESKNEQLVKINNELDNFIYTASHDLRAPISNIEGLMNALLKNLPEEIREGPFVNKIITMIDSSIDRFKNTIRELTEITKIQKQLDEELSLVKLSKLTKEIELDLEAEISRTDAEIRTDFNNCDEIKFSEKNLRSIIYNLISNAIKYHSSGRKPEIYVSSNFKNGYYELKIQDNGLGIDSSQHGKIFSMFKRVHSHVEGTGVGLYIVKKIVDNIGGKIEIESEVGKGSLFTVYLKALD